MTLQVENNFVIPQIWRIFRQNNIKAEIRFPVQMYNHPTEKWNFNFDHYKLQGVTDRILTESITIPVDPLSHVKQYPFIVKVDHRIYSISRCLDWLVANLNDNEWLMDDFRGEFADIFESGRGNKSYLLKNISIFFANKEDANFFKVVKEDFRDHRINI